MNPLTHFLTGWVVASCSPSLSVKERAFVTLAGVAPDIDGMGAIPELLTRSSSHPLNWFSLYHHQLHNLGFGLFVAGVTFVIARHRWTAGFLALASFQLHLLGDLLGARGPDGYQWPIPYFMPFSHAAQLTWHGQWALNAWQNYVITGGLLIATFYLAWSTGRSPLEMISAQANKAFAATLRRRLPSSVQEPARRGHFD